MQTIDKFNFAGKKAFVRVLSDFIVWHYKSFQKTPEKSKFV